MAVAYTLRFTGLLLFSLTAISLLFAPFVLSPPNLTRWEAALILTGMWLWLYGVNVAVAYLRFPKWVRRTLLPDE